MIIAEKNNYKELKSLIENDEKSHFFLDEAFGIGAAELIEVDKVLSKDLYFWIAYQREDKAPQAENLKGKTMKYIFYIRPIDELPFIVSLLSSKSLWGFQKAMNAIVIFLNVGPSKEDI